MSVTTYAELKSAIASWANRTDLTTQLDDFVTLAEAKINRRLRVNEMETALAETAIASDVVARPAGMVAIKAIWVTGANQRTLEQKTLEYIVRQPSSSSTPQFYAWSAANLHFYPSSGSVAAVYYTKVPALSAGVNWLLTACPDLYLWASLEQAAIFLRDTEALGIMGGKADSLIEELNGRSVANQISGGPLVARVR